MGAALLEGLINADTTFTLCLSPDADGKARPPTTTSVREIFCLMEINKKNGLDSRVHRLERHVYGLFFQHGARDL
jgi:hypothetical protein